MSLPEQPNDEHRKALSDMGETLEAMGENFILVGVGSLAVFGMGTAIGDIELSKGLALMGVGLLVDGAGMASNFFGLFLKRQGL